MKQLPTSSQLKNKVPRPKKRALAHNLGKVTVICGPMFAGKSEELLRMLHRLAYANVPYLIFKPAIDSRVKSKVKSRDGRTNNAIEIKSSTEILEHIKKINSFPFVVAVDEAQFLDSDLIDVVQILSSLKIRVIISGLDTDFNHIPFGPMSDLMAIADEVNKLSAICLSCGGVATRTYRIPSAQKISNATVLIGDKDTYEARCSKCHPGYQGKFKEEKKELVALIKKLESNYYKKRNQKKSK